MKSLFSQSALFFPQFWVFEAIFEARGQNFQIFKNSVCTFYCIQNDHLNPTISMQKSVWKTDHPGSRYLRKTKWGCSLVWQISRPRVVRKQIWVGQQLARAISIRAVDWQWCTWSLQMTFFSFRFFSVFPPLSTLLIGVLSAQIKKLIVWKLTGVPKIMGYTLF